ncbi:DUF932 domain-containing protein, partial [Escherichia coli]|uniref:DUF932 domain-containing protein n=1 Tax=Escherichia coli TaxID=562 RepID=UPI002B230F99
HDGTSSYQMLPGYFRFVCQNGCVCGQSLGEVRVPHRGNVVDRVIEGAYEVVGVFDRIEEKRDAMQSLKSRYGESEEILSLLNLYHNLRRAGEIN